MAEEGGVFGIHGILGAPARRGFRAETERMRVLSEGKQKELAYQQKIRDLLEDAYDRFSGPDDKPELNATLQSIFRSIEQESGGRKVNPVVQKYLTNPEKAKELLDFTRESGITLGELFTMTGDPLSTASALVAFGKARQRQRFAAALPGAEGAEAAPPPAAAVEPTTDNPDVARMQARLKFLEASRARAVASAPDPQSRTAALASLDTEMKQIREDLSRLGPQRTLAIEAEGRQPIGDKEVEDARREATARGGVSATVAGRMFYPGMPRSQFMERRALISGGEAPAQATPAPAAAQPTTVPALLPEQREEQARQAQQRRERELIETRSREQVNEAVLKKWEEGADSRRRLRTIRDSLESLVTQAGPTGEFIAPIRQGFNNAAQLLGIENPTKLNEFQLLDLLNKNLATESLRDFSGPDSDRDVLRAIELNPGIRNTRTANMVLLAIAKAEDNYQQDRLLNARRWITQYGSLSNNDPVTRKNFHETWESFMAKEKGVGTTLAKKLGLKLPKKARQ